MSRLARLLGTLRWLACAFIGVSLVYLVLVSVSQRVEAAWVDLPVLVALAALSLPYRIRRERCELANWVVVLLSCAAASSLAAPDPSTPSLAFFTHMFTAVFFAGMLLLPAAVGARVMLPFIAVVVIVMTLVPDTNGDLIRDDPAVFSAYQAPILAAMALSALTLHPLMRATSRWGASSRRQAGDRREGASPEAGS